MSAMSGRGALAERSRPRSEVERQKRVKESSVAVYLRGFDVFLGILFLF